MPKVTFIAHDGQEHVVNALEGATLMEAAIENSVPGIDADCGGGCSCATCHVYVEPDWVGKVGAAAAGMEDDMLGLNPERKETSRLSCQVKLTNEHDGLVVRIPEFQI